MGLDLIYPYEALKERAMSTPDRKAWGGLRLGRQTYPEFYFLTWAEVLSRVERCAEFLRGAGLKRGDHVGILAKNSLEWLIIDIASMSAGFVSVPLYAQSHPSEIRYILDEAEIKILFTDERFESYACNQILIRDLEDILPPPAGSFTPSPADANDVCTIIYTSGTSGVPKGVMHTPKTCFEAFRIANAVMRMTRKDILFSYLPLSHVAERVLIEFGSIYTGAEVCILDRVERLAQFLPKVRPSVFLAVPRVWETLRSKIDRELSSNPLLQQRLQAIPFFLRKWILSRFIKKKLGLDRIRLCLSGAAKLSADTATAFSNWGIILHEGYGLTETLCTGSFNRIKKARFGTVGQIYDGLQCELGHDGEILLKGPSIFKGYFKHPEWTDEVVKEGWYHTGDIGEFDSEGYLTITDRKKNLFKASNGKYVAPLPIEILLKKHPAIQEVVVLGEGKPHCIALSTVNEEIFKAEELVKHLAEVNSFLAPHEQIRALGCMKGAWSCDGGELTASLKVRRRVILQKYDSQIQMLYETSSRVVCF